MLVFKTLKSSNIIIIFQKYLNSNMKFILLLVLAFVVLKAANENVLFSADYSKYAT